MRSAAACAPLRTALCPWGSPTDEVAVKEVGKDMHVALIATSPIRCGEHEIGVNDWREMDRGELLMFAAGKAWGHGLLPDVVQRLSLYEDTEWYNLFGQIL